MGRRGRRVLRDDKLNAAWGLSKAVDGQSARCSTGIRGSVPRERKSDVEFVFERVLRNLLGRASPGRSRLRRMESWFATDLSPADTAQPTSPAVSGLITDAGGGKTSHTADPSRDATRSPRLFS